ncbi:auxin-responsive protein SAUR21 [Dendrobium catenatum]|uniref:Indole-3-acetic acid-induced protein ARG7 n=1 Tax=Dendrobium catenatum TaxID=906689 RepID=A0A2I0VK32_9ASPA|nr:auxin-responsive protein SAUR21 [Dendrobium catenatum]PKU63772.1 Indole-3-acetic acid-induced protein ARG7 [Dendrobium catenatum]
MPFNKARGPRLRRRLVQGWRWMLPGRSTAYSLLEPPSYQFTEENSGSPPGMEKLARWVLSLKHRLKKPKLVVGGEGEKRPPKGHLVVYVGGGEKGVVDAQPKRYVVPVVYFNHPLFGELLREVEEEFGYRHPGGITIPCSVYRFERVKARIAGDSCG